MCDSNLYSGQRPTLICKICFKTKNVKRCSRCQAAFYCSNVCQRIDWPTHKPQCHERDRTSDASCAAAAPMVPATMQPTPLQLPLQAMAMTTTTASPLQVPMQQAEAAPFIDQSFFATYCNPTTNNNMLFDTGSQLPGVSAQLPTPSPEHQTQQQQQQYCIQPQSSSLSTADTQESLFGSSFVDMVENEIDLRDELNEILFGSGELTDLQLDDDTHNHLGIDQDNTMHINNDNFFNNPELNLPFR